MERNENMTQVLMQGIGSGASLRIPIRIFQTKDPEQEKYLNGKLLFLADFLIKNPQIKIDIMMPMELNEILDREPLLKQKARQIQQYFRNHGIDASRIQLLNEKNQDMHRFHDRDLEKKFWQD
jgi:hypothetical protein